MDKFEREQLKEALKSGNTPSGEVQIGQLDNVLRALAQQYRARKFACEQHVNGQLARLEAIKDFLAGLRDTAGVLYAFEAEARHIIRRLSDAVQHSIDFLQNETIPRRHHLWISRCLRRAER